MKREGADTDTSGPHDGAHCAAPTVAVNVADLLMVIAHWSQNSTVADINA